MKNISTLIVCLTFIIACKEQKQNEVKKDAVQYVSYGEKFTDENVISKELAAKEFGALKEGDTISLKFASSVNEVCKSKGCWMKLDLGSSKESTVKFKDYGFFVPLDVATKEVIVNGRAFVTKVPVKELRHFAKDAGKTEEEITTITEPEFTYAFEADGVLLRE